ncbi:translation initiation factor eIF 4e-like domain-containing protein [Ephemerocybe angulata]|uniref:Translation initiation factor eIF 4e-like domain-containing protein n=1 Tax=Ephemerocybe angulata TaxID=980116 RepID=A0A8H6LW94_9AGAR|nr:translation initiation factor eIF 4e-like domain-containing protein [Tulosesus angulatus]
MGPSDAMDVDSPSSPYVGWVAPPTSNVYHNPDGSTWIKTCWDDEISTADRINEFLARWPPSGTPDTYAGWISVVRCRIPSPNAIPADVPALQQSFQAPSEAGQVTTASLDDIAKRHGVVVGKWLIFSSGMEGVDGLWANVVRLVCTERRRGSAKVSTRKAGPAYTQEGQGNEHVICVYVDDYTNLQDVMELRDDLGRIGIHWKIGFKPDSYTHLGIYSQNKWGIRPTRYSGRALKLTGLPVQSRKVLRNRDGFIVIFRVRDLVCAESVQIVMVIIREDDKYYTIE